MVYLFSKILTSKKSPHFLENNLQFIIQNTSILSTHHQTKKNAHKYFALHTHTHTPPKIPISLPSLYSQPKRKFLSYRINLTFNIPPI